jgi:hypothetical protein
MGRRAAGTFPRHAPLDSGGCLLLVVAAMGHAWASPVVVQTRSQHYRSEAARILQIAHRTANPMVKIHLMEIAQRYMQLARDDDAR